MWARIHKLDRVRALPKGGALIVIEDERSAAQMQRVPSMTTLIAIARVLAAKRAIEAKFDGKGEVRYATNAKLPSELSEAITKAGAAIADGSGDRILIPARASGVAALIDVAFSELAHYVRGSVGVIDIGAALRQVEAKRRATPLDRDKQPELYWPAVLELAALAGEQSRSLGGRWIDTRDLPVPFALKMADGAVAHPTVVAQKIVEGGDVEDMLSTAKPAARPPAAAKSEPEVEAASSAIPDEEPAIEEPLPAAETQPAGEAPADEEAPPTDAPATDKPS